MIARLDVLVVALTQTPTSGCVQAEIERMRARDTGSGVQAAF